MAWKLHGMVSLFSCGGPLPFYPTGRLMVDLISRQENLATYPIQPKIPNSLLYLPDKYHRSGRARARVNGRGITRASGRGGGRVSARVAARVTARVCLPYHRPYRTRTKRVSWRAKSTSGTPLERPLLFSQKFSLFFPRNITESLIVKTQPGR